VRYGLNSAGCEFNYENDYCERVLGCCARVGLRTHVRGLERLGNYVACLRLSKGVVRAGLMGRETACPGLVVDSQFCTTETGQHAFVFLPPAIYRGKPARWLWMCQAWVLVLGKMLL
jgi:hypothetical protein